MLTALSIQDVVLIDRLELSFDDGLTVLTGETGAGKSILMDSLGLALGARADQGLVRVGAAQAAATAVFSLKADHPALMLLQEHGINAEEELVLRRVIGRDGRSRAFVNDAAVGAGLLRRLGALLVEVQGQHDQMGLADPGGHTALLDAFGVPIILRREVGTAWRAWRDATNAETAARTALEAALRDQEFLRHATTELRGLAPEPGEEEQLAAERQHLQSAERRAETIAAALSELAPSSGRQRSAGPAAAVRQAARALQRLTAPTPDEADALAALERAEDALAEAEAALERVADAAQPDPRRLEAAEERLFALRGMARKHAVQVAELPALLAGLEDRLAALETGEAEIDRLRRHSEETRVAYTNSCTHLSAARERAVQTLDRAVMRELPPLKLDRARFVTQLIRRDETQWGPDGTESAQFLISTNPGQTPGALGRVASGGELSRLMLALKVVLAGASPVATLVFDEVDSGIGGATAAAVGERLALLAASVQVLLVTHSPQVAARGRAHLLVAKRAAQGRAETQVIPLESRERREEIARMLAGATVTDAARAAADSLLRGQAA